MWFTVYSPVSSSATPTPRASAKSKSRLTSGRPRSVYHLDTALSLTPNFSASCRWVICCRSRKVRMAAPVMYCICASSLYDLAHTIPPLPAKCNLPTVELQKSDNELSLWVFTSGICNSKQITLTLLEIQRGCSFQLGKCTPSAYFAPRNSGKQFIITSTNRNLSLHISHFCKKIIITFSLHINHLV